MLFVTRVREVEIPPCAGRAASGTVVSGVGLCVRATGGGCSEWMSFRMRPFVKGLLTVTWGVAKTLGMAGLRGDITFSKCWSGFQVVEELGLSSHINLRWKSGHAMGRVQQADGNMWAQLAWLAWRRHQVETVLHLVFNKFETSDWVGVLFIFAGFRTWFLTSVIFFLKARWILFLFLYFSNFSFWNFHTYVTAKKLYVERLTCIVSLDLIT